MSRHQHRSRMQPPSRSLVIVFFFACYVLFTLYLAGVEHSCPTFEELARQEENRPLMQSIERIARSANVESKLGDEVQAPLAKLGIRVPVAEPPVEQGVEPTKADAPPTPKPTYFAHEERSPDELLRGDSAPNNVFYVWCGKRWFEFHHYLSVMSVIRELRPDNIIFFYDIYPVIDSWTYNTWFDELRHDYPFFRIWLMDPAENPCAGFAKVNQTFIGNLLTYRGGMYIHENTIIRSFPLKYRNYTIVNALDPVTNKGFVMTKRGQPGRFISFEEAMARPRLRSSIYTMQCRDMPHYNQARKKPFCVNTEKSFFPKDIWELDNSFGSLARQVFYGDSKIRRPEKSYDELIPNIAHIVWLGGGNMDYLFYLCVLSLIYVAEVDRVYIHGDAPPSGIYWEQVKGEEKLTLIYREMPGTVYGNTVNVISHVTDVWRVDFMVKYGGIYVDTDTVFVRPLDREIRAYDAVGSYDWTYWNDPFPDTINFGVAIGKKNAKYWNEFQKSMRWFMDKDWSWNGLRQPYRIQERHPELVKIDPHLQVICFEALCHPTWWPNYHDEKVHHLNSKSITNWRNDTYAFHWTLPTPDELLNEENLLKSDSIFAEIGRHILQKAGKLK